MSKSQIRINLPVLSNINCIWKMTGSRGISKVAAPVAQVGCNEALTRLEAEGVKKGGIEVR